jgi:hypothetical protein
MGSRMKAALMALGIAAIVFLVGVAVATTMLWRATHPAMLPADDMTAQARFYLQALEDGDATTALALTGDLDADMMHNGGSLGAQTNLLTDEVLGGAVERIHDVQIVDTFTISESILEESGPDNAGTVDITYELGGQSHQAKLIYDYPDGHWQLAQGLSSQLMMYTTGGRDIVPFTISGVLSTDDAVGPDSSQFLFQVFPAVYEVQPVVDPNWTGSKGYEVCDELSCWDVATLADGTVPAQDVAVAPPVTVTFTVSAHPADRS